MLKFGLSQNNIDRLAGIFSKYPAVEHVDIFGSRAKGTFRSGSDIDLAVFLWHSRSTQAISLKDYATRLEQPAPTFVKVCRKLGHFGIMLIITSWIVPIING